MKKILIILVTFLLFIGTVSAAEFSEQKGFDWLSAQASDGGYNTVTTTAFAALAFDGVGYSTQADAAVSWILTQKDASGCFPSGGCTVKDTAMALKAINQVSPSEDTSDIVSWLDSAKSAYTGSGAWGLFINTDESGTCEISYTLNAALNKDTVEVQNSKFPNCGNAEFLDLDRCFKQNLLSNNPGISLTVDCSALSGTPFITLAYNKANEWYLQNTWEQNVADVTVNNGCFGSTSRAVCTKDASLYTDWVLQDVGESTISNFYLKTNYVNSEVLDNSFMYLITQNPSYLETLASYQRSDGSFDASIEKTAISVLGMKNDPAFVSNAEEGIEWLKTQQQEDGSFGDITKTAFVLFTSFSDTYFGGSDINYDVECEIDDDCFTNEVCTDGFCVSTINITDIECDFSSECDFGEVCEDNQCVTSEEECSFSSDCLEGEECKAGKCVIEGGDNPNTDFGCFDDSGCSDGEECIDGSCITKKEGNNLWVFILIGVLILGGVGFVVYNKFLKGSPKKPGAKKPGEFKPFSSKLGTKPQNKPFSDFKPSQGFSRSAASERALNKSLQEAKKLLKK